MRSSDVLPVPFGPEDGQQLASLELEAEPFEQGAIAEPEREVVDRDRRSSREGGRERAGLVELPLLEGQVRRQGLGHRRRREYPPSARRRAAGR